MEDAVSLATIIVSDEIAMEDTNPIVSSSDSATVSDEIAMEDSVSITGPVNVSDEIAMEDVVSLATIIVSDEIAMEDASSSSAPATTYNTLILRVAHPTNTRLGGVFSGVCNFAQNYSMIGIYDNGTIRCARLP